MRPAVAEPRAEARRKRAPVVGRSVFGLHLQRTERPAAEGLRPVRPRHAAGVEGDDFEPRAILVDGDEPSAGLTRNAHVESSDAALRILLEGEQPLDERVAKKSMPSSSTAYSHSNEPTN